MIEELTVAGYLEGHRAARLHELRPAGRKAYLRIRSGLELLASEKARAQVRAARTFTGLRLLGRAVVPQGEKRPPVLLGGTPGPVLTHPEEADRKPGREGMGWRGREQRPERKGRAPRRRLVDDKLACIVAVNSGDSGPRIHAKILLDLLLSVAMGSGFAFETARAWSTRALAATVFPRRASYRRVM